MRKLRLKSKKEFERLYASGMRLKSLNRPDSALKFLAEADTIARHHNDRRRRLDVLNPMAQILWSSGEFDKAKQKLALAAKISGELGLRDELAIAFSNHGRLVAVKIIKQMPVSKQAKALRQDALPYFMKAHNLLQDHDHLYFRYANAKHGSMVAALAQEYKKASLLVAEGMGVAFKKSRKYDKEVTFTISPSGLEYLATATQLIKLGTKNPASREYKNQEKLARELIK
jgi:tetratricopeptide (TPR) repeat protein